MATMAQSVCNTRNTRNTHTYVDRTHSLTLTSTQLKRDHVVPKRLLIYYFLSACWVFSRFRHPTNSDMVVQDLFRACVVILMRAYTHRGWAHRQRVSTTVGKIHKFVLCS